MKISNTEIAEAGLVTEGAVRKAVASGRLDAGDLVSILTFVLIGRLKSEGLNGVVNGCDLHYEPMDDFGA